MSKKQKRSPDTIAIIAAVVIFAAMMFMFLPAYSSENTYNLAFGFSNTGSTVRAPVIPITIAVGFSFIALILSSCYKWLIKWKWSLLCAGVLCVVAAVCLFCTQPFYQWSVDIGWNRSYPSAVEAGPIVVGVFLSISGVGLVVWNILTAKGIAQ